MSRRIEIELTSARPDGTWTWRAAGAREPKGVLAGSILPGGSGVGDVFKVDADFDIEGISILAIVQGGRSRKEPTRLEILPSERPFEAVTQQLARPPRGDDDRRGPRRDRDGDRGDRGPRGDRPGGDRGPRPPRGDRPGGDRPSSDRGPRPDRPTGDRPGGTDRGPRPPRSDRPAGDRPVGDRPAGDRGPRPPRPEGERANRPPRERREQRPHFAPPPEMPQRPKAKRLKPGRAHRTAVLEGLPEEHRAIAELTVQGLAAVRQRLREDNVKLKAEGKPEMPETSVMKIAEELMPKVRVAEWLDRAEAAKRDLDELDLRDLRSVVASSEDPILVRDDTTRALAAELKAALATKQESATREWLEDIATAVSIGRVVRALKMSSEPPKAGIRFPAELAAKLSEATVAALTPDSSSERWLALVESVAFSPIRALVTPSGAPAQVSDDLRATVTKLAPAIPQIAKLFGIDVPPGSPMPKPPRVMRRPEKKPNPKPVASGPRPAAPAPTAAPTEAPNDEVTEAVADTVEDVVGAVEVVEAVAETVETVDVPEVAEAAEVVEPVAEAAEPAEPVAEAVEPVEPAAEVAEVVPAVEPVAEVVPAVEPVAEAVAEAVADDAAAPEDAPEA